MSLTFALLLLSSPIQAAPLVDAAVAPRVAAQPIPGPSAFQEVKKSKRKDSSGGGKIWFAFWFPEEMKPQVEEKKWLLFLIGWLLGGIGGSLWGPIVLVGAEFDMEWALPSLIYTIVSWLCLVPLVIIWIPWVGWALVLAGSVASLILGWIGAHASIANINRPEIELQEK